MSSASAAMEPRPISEIAASLGIRVEELEIRGAHVGKLRLELLDRWAFQVQGKLVLVTAVTPTNHGEGKTVVSIGLAQGLRKLGRKAVVTLRQPSLGPIFGLKGGATGGGKSQVLPAELINLHFTGDFHAIAAAHNLLAAMIDSHIYHGNALDIDAASITWPRTVDMNDRALRHITVAEGGKSNGLPRESGFVITAASEIMAILALASSREDLRQRLERIVIGFRKDGSPVRAKDLQCTGAMMVLLRDAILPNLVQTSEHTPALIHAGPFGNIAHGTCSVLAQKMALGLADFVVNETGFAADLGAEKYFDIVMPATGLRPAAAVVVASVRALRAQASESDPRGFANLDRHLENLAKFGVSAVVALNRFAGDTDEDVDAVRAHCEERGVRFAVTDGFVRGGDGAVDLAQQVIEVSSGAPAEVRSLFPADAPATEKIERIAREIYGADGVRFEAAAQEKLLHFETLGFGRLPVCIAKTQASLSDDPKRTGVPTEWTLTITDIHLAAGAGFLIAVAGKMVLMPGLGKDPQAVHLDVDERGVITGMY
ncbi:MAG: formate--tetrahydrofolate ligase [Bryobacteraceae bacterium]